MDGGRDPTEVALIVAAMRAGLDPDVLHIELPRLAEIPFTSERKKMEPSMRRSPKRNGRGSSRSRKTSAR